MIQCVGRCASLSGEDKVCSLQFTKLNAPRSVDIKDPDPQCGNKRSVFEEKRRNEGRVKFLVDGQRRGPYTASRVSGVYECGTKHIPLIATLKQHPMRKLPTYIIFREAFRKEASREELSARPYRRPLLRSHYVVA
ncbi:hypothetical protein EVAR_81642_1 [Eumeta japonica]|uniref:Uncharacterized protein n=1 Tax=Eumeta variegata TaxID=151549 RepID=A0A4C1V4D1_EUMVA|nr:hypothetical protein EVAR_81642_1 [Eumeta japonica]